MVIYNLVCVQQHQFEGWFRSEQDYNEQKLKHLLSCPICESMDVRRIPSASYIGKGVAKKVDREMDQKETFAAVNQSVMDKIRQYLSTNSENVGGRFAEEAKKMHYGEAEERAIHGQATVDEVKDLHDEGISTVILPFNIGDKKKYN